MLVRVMGAESSCRGCCASRDVQELKVVSLCSSRQYASIDAVVDAYQAVLQMGKPL